MGVFSKYLLIVILLAWFSGCTSIPKEQHPPVVTWAEKIREKVRSNLAIPDGVPKNAVVKFLVTQLPNGEIIRVSLVSASGFPNYDQAVERALFKSSPLPKAPTPEEFVKDIQFTFTPGP